MIQWQDGRIEQRRGRCSFVRLNLMSPQRVCMFFLCLQYVYVHRYLGTCVSMYSYMYSFIYVKVIIYTSETMA